MTLKKYMLAALLSFSFNTLLAHAIWIETNTTGKIGQAQEVSVFLGEYGENQRDSIQHWFSNMTAFALYVTAPDGTKKQVNCVANGNHFKGTFTPDVAGTYVLSIDHTVKDVYGGNKIHYYALGVVTVNKSLNGINNLKDQPGLVLLAANEKAHKINTPENVHLLFNKTSPAESDLTVESPAGWGKKFKADKSGNVTFSPYWAGRYLLEGTFSEKASGQHEGSEFTSVWHCVTYCLDVEK
jgi:hypothetical protein